MKFHKNFRFQFFFVKSLEIESENSLSKRFDYNGYITEYCLTDLTVIRPVNHRGTAVSPFLLAAWDVSFAKRR